MTSKKPKAKKKAQAKKKPKSSRASGKLKATREKKVPFLIAKLRDPDNVDNMADTFFRFMLPFLEIPENDEQCDFLLTIGMMAWNMGLLADESKALIDESFVFEEIFYSDSEVKIFEAMIERKEEEFAEFTDVLFGYEINSKPTGEEILIKHVPQEG